MTTSKTARREPPPAPGAPTLSDPAARVLRRFRLVFNAVKTHFREVEKKAGVGGAHVWALSVIRAEPGISMNGLARAMDIHQSTASNLVKSLVEMGLVQSVRGGADRRGVQLNSTAQGLKVLRKAPGPFTGVLPQALDSLDAATLARLDRDLGRVIELLGADERGAGIPLGQT